MTIPTHPTVIVDIDGVLADFTHGFSAKYGEGHLQRSTGGQQTWALADGPVSAGQVDKAWQEVHLDPEFWRELQCIITKPETAEFNHLVNALGLDVWYLTARDFSAEDATRRWLQAKGMPRWAQVICGRSKVDAIRELQSGLPVLHGYHEARQIVAIIDDSPDNVVGMLGHGLPVYVRDWRYNRHVSAMTGAVHLEADTKQGRIPIRVTSFGEFNHALRELGEHWKFVTELEREVRAAGAAS